MFCLRFLIIRMEKIRVNKEKMVSIVVVTYNPKWEKLKSTVLSAILQQGIDFEIIITDDGSANNYFEELKKLFKMHDFTDYSLLESKKNKGTVYNLKKGVDAAIGKYIKDISPGDYFYSDNTIADWIAYVQLNDVKVSFGKAVYYNDDVQFNIIKHRTAPKYINGYRYGYNDSTRKEYLLMDDMALGAAVLCEREILNKYLSLIVDKVKLGEDFAYSLMVFNGIHLNLYDKNVVFYEFGNGVSTSGNERYTAIMLADWENMHNIMLNCDVEDFFSIRFKQYIKNYNKYRNHVMKRIIKCMILPETIWWKFKLSTSKEYFDTNCDIKFLNKIMTSNDA